MDFGIYGNKCYFIRVKDWLVYTLQKVFTLFKLKYLLVSVCKLPVLHRNDSFYGFKQNISSFQIFNNHEQEAGFPGGSDSKESTCIVGDLG